MDSSRQSTMESWMMVNGKPGDVFYSEKMDRHLTAIANYYQRRIVTERVIAVSMGKKSAESKYITKVIILK